MKKKIILIILLVFCLCGCTNINNSNPEELSKEVINSNLSLSNQYRTGYKYYLPNNMIVKYQKDRNEILSDGHYKYYLYVDLVSYYKKASSNYKINQDSYLSKDLTNKKKIGYLEVNVKNDKYLIEIMYNYAKIELIVDKDDINDAITKSLILLTTIKYNDNIIKNLMDEDVLSSSEEKFSIFDTNKTTSNFLEYVQEYGTYEGSDAVPDYDLIN